MKFSVNTKELAEALQNLLRAVSSKTSIPALEGILIKTDVGSIRLFAYDLEISMQTQILANIQENGNIILSAKLFSDIVRKAPADILTVSIDEKNIAVITSGDSTFNIIGINADEFPEIPSVNSGSNKLVVPGEILRSMIRQTIFAVAETDTKPIYQGSKFVIEDGVLDIVSVDGFRLALRRENILCSFNDNFVVPGKTLSEIMKLIKESDVEIYPSRKHIMFKIDNYTVVSDLIESTERVALLISDRLKSPIRFYFDNNEIKLSCTTSIGRATDKIGCYIEGPGLEMGFNSRYLLDALRNTECDEVIIKVTGALKQMVIVPKEGDSFRFLVLPVRLKND